MCDFWREFLSSQLLGVILGAILTGGFTWFIEWRKSVGEQKHHIRENVGIILQDPFLYAKTIYENIGIASKDISNEIVYKAAKQLQFMATFNHLKKDITQWLEKKVLHYQGDKNKE